MENKNQEANNGVLKMEGEEEEGETMSGAAQFFRHFPTRKSQLEQEENFRKFWEQEEIRLAQPFSPTIAFVDLTIEGTEISNQQSENNKDSERDSIQTPSPEPILLYSRGYNNARHKERTPLRMKNITVRQLNLNDISPPPPDLQQFAELQKVVAEIPGEEVPNVVAEIPVAELPVAELFVAEIPAEEFFVAEVPAEELFVEEHPNVVAEPPVVELRNSSQNEEEEEDLEQILERARKRALALQDDYEERLIVHNTLEIDDQNLLYNFGADVGDFSSDDDDEDDDDDDDDDDGSDNENNENGELKKRRRRTGGWWHLTNKLSTHKKYPLIIFNNNIYRPKEETKHGLVVARCTYIHEDKKCCPGAIHCSRNTGSIAQYKDCNHDPRRDYCAMELLIRRLSILDLSGSTKDHLNDIATEGADFYEITHLLKDNEWIARKLNDMNSPGSCSKQFPPSFDWSAFPDVMVLMDTSGNFKNKPVTLVWRIKGSKKWLNADTKTIHIDGKFSNIPSGFRQLYLIGTQDTKSGKTIPLIFALSTSSTMETYTEIFQVAKKEGLDPEFVYSDFEQAAIGAVSAVWPISTICLCYRHWTVSIRKKLKTLLGIKAIKTAIFKRVLKTIFSFSFAPLPKVYMWFRVFRLRALSLHPKMPAFFEYLESTYFGPNATYKTGHWNCRNRCIQRQEFTNNPSERLFSKYSRLFSHNNYQQLNVAVRRSLDWAKSTYRMEDTERAKMSRKKKYVFYKDEHFLKCVTEEFLIFDDFEKRLHGFMKIPSLYH